MDSNRQRQDKELLEVFHRLSTIDKAALKLSARWRAWQARRRHNRREFWEEIGVYAQPIIIGGLVLSKGEL